MLRELAEQCVGRGPLISVITPTYNAAATLRSTLASVAAQDGAIEHLVIDGGSTDGTLDVLRAWTNHRIDWLSEPDRGISHAFNKGIARARGDLIMILNADDCVTPGALMRANAALRNQRDAGFAFGHCAHKSGTDPMRIIRGDARYFDHMRSSMPHVHHPTMVVRSEVYQRIGGYDEKWRLAMDYDWLIRAEKAGIRGVLIDVVQAEMSMGGVSDRQWTLAYAEARDIAIAHGAPPLVAWTHYVARRCKRHARNCIRKIGADRIEDAIRKKFLR